MKSSITRMYRYIRFRRGHGVHSPFAFGLINKVIEEKRPFYAFDEIETKKGYRLGLSSKRKYGRLLYRLINFFHSQTVLQVGIADDLKTKYIVAAAPRLKVVDAADLPALDQAIETLGTLDFVFLNISENAVHTREVFDQCMHHAGASAVFVVDGIHKKNMRMFWRQLKNRSDIPVTMDLYALGLVFLNRKMNKKNYKIFF